MSHRQAAAEDKLNRILAAATNLFAKKGYHGTAVPEIASAAGVGAGTIYRYFTNKEALVNAVFIQSKQQLGEYIARDMENAAAFDLQAGFLQLWQNVSRFATDKPDAFRFLELQDHREYLDRQSRQLERQILAPLRLFAIKGKRDGVIRNLPSMTLVAMVWGAFVGLQKASTQGYVTLSNESLSQAAQASWQLLSH